jgi:hypothetical protein
VYVETSQDLVPACANTDSSTNFLQFGSGLENLRRTKVSKTSDGYVLISHSDVRKLSQKCSGSEPTQT